MCKRFPMVNIDPLQVRRVYENLINNALEYNRAGLHLTIKVRNNYNRHQKRSHLVSQHWTHCIVSDNGMGIAPQQLSQLFDRLPRSTQAPSFYGGVTLT